VKKRTSRTLLRVVQDECSDATDAILAGEVWVDGSIVTNPEARIFNDSSVIIRRKAELRGKPKLTAALDHFRVEVQGKTVLDLGAAAGGFTQAVLERGAEGVVAVDVGHGQLVGSLRQDPRVRNLESTNISDLRCNELDIEFDLVVMDLSYLSLANALPQIPYECVASGAELVALVKPMFELSLPSPPVDEPHFQEAVGLAQRAADATGWRVIGSMRSPVTGARGAVEFFIHARRGKE
jgi:23S rRNA (cytidine1920-2'-O)/16S rRNA (cytidine1409-2'-O)-methyltransferase